VPDLAETVIDSLGKVEIAHPVAEAVSTLIRKRCKNAQNSFRN